jgi:hypothetical protein
MRMGGIVFREGEGPPDEAKADPGLGRCTNCGSLKLTAWLVDRELFSEIHLGMHHFTFRRFGCLRCGHTEDVRVVK